MICRIEERKCHTRLEELHGIMDWIRKHYDELAAICLAQQGDSALPPGKQQLFVYAYSKVKLASTLPVAGGSEIARVALMATCVACKAAHDYPCSGRTTWQEKCQLLQSTLVPR